VGLSSITRIRAGPRAALGGADAGGSAGRRQLDGERRAFAAADFSVILPRVP
jgi:hypothetical protein